MKFASIITLLLIAIIMFLDGADTRRGRGGGSSRSSRGRSSYTTRSSYRPSRYSKYARTTTRVRSDRQRVHGYYRPYGGHVLVVGSPFYDVHYGYYYDGHSTWRRANPSSKYMYTKGTFPFNDSPPGVEEDLTSLNAEEIIKGEGRRSGGSSRSRSYSGSRSSRPRSYGYRSYYVRRARVNPSAKYMYTKGTFPFNDSQPGLEEDLTSLNAEETIRGEGRRSGGSSRSRSYSGSRSYTYRSYTSRPHGYRPLPIKRMRVNPSAKYLYTKGTFPFNDSSPGSEELISLNSKVEQMSPTLLISSGIALLIAAFFMLSLYIAPKQKGDKEVKARMAQYGDQQVVTVNSA